jgi:pimeloyl-ACP methyl ester carboxylesterase
VKTTINKLQINYEIIGEGVPVVFLHGWGGSLESLKKLAELITAEGYQAILIDLPGFGKSDTPKKSYTLGEYAETTELLLFELKINNCYVFGHSFGGSIGIKLVLRDEVSVNKLILCNSSGVRNLDSRKQKFWERVAHYARKSVSIPLLRRPYAVIRKLFYYYILRNRDYIDHPELAETFKNVIHEDLTQQLQRIDIPVTLIWGELDKDTPVEHAKIMHKELRYSDLYVLEGQGHGLPKNKPELVSPIVIGFLKE